MARIYDCSVDTDLLTGTRLARAALSRGELVVLPTDTVYGIAANAFDPAAVARLLGAKGRGRQSPPPVLIGDVNALDALAQNVPDSVRDLAREFWPGGLTIVLHAQPSLVWDLGDTEGTVALRIPDNALTIELLKDTGPLAVSSANLTGEVAARDAQSAHDYFADNVEVYLDGGRVGDDAARENGVSESSTIIDATAIGFEGGTFRILRQGVVSADRIRAVVGSLLPTDEERAAADETEAPAPDVTPDVAPSGSAPAWAVVGDDVVATETVADSQTEAAESSTTSRQGE